MINTPFITQEELDAARITYDVLPQLLFDSISKANDGKNPYGHLVSVYRPGHIMPFIQPTSWTGSLMLDRWQESRK